MKKYGIAIIGLVISISLYLFTITFKLELFESFAELMKDLEKYEIDEKFFPLLIIIISTTINFWIVNKKKAIKLEKYKIYKAMISSTHHIMNNFLNQIQLIKITAEEMPDFDSEILEIYEKTLNEATRQIRALSSIKNIDEDTIKDSVSPKRNKYKSN